MWSCSWSPLLTILRTFCGWQTRYLPSDRYFPVSLLPTSTSKMSFCHSCENQWARLSACGGWRRKIGSAPICWSCWWRMSSIMSISARLCSVINPNFEKHVHFEHLCFKLLLTVRITQEILRLCQTGIFCWSHLHQNPYPSINAQFPQGMFSVVLVVCWRQSQFLRTKLFHQIWSPALDFWSKEE